jgi:hypothetical protein
MENHTYCATNYREQILLLERIYNEERIYQLEEEKKKQEALYGPSKTNPEEETKASPLTLSGKPLIVYKNRI